jgi:hypothetical protein
MGGALLKFHKTATFEENSYSLVVNEMSPAIGGEPEVRMLLLTLLLLSFSLSLLCLAS